MNRLRASEIVESTCPVVEGREKILDGYSAYLADESRMPFDVVDAIFFPSTTEQVVDAVLKIREQGRSIVVSGARTGITGGAIGIENASIISLEKMDTACGGLTYQAGVRLENIPQSDGMYYPVDPTEMTASIGGTVATDASGARSYYYGSTRQFIDGLTVVLSDGTVLKLKRGEVLSENGEFVLESKNGDVKIPLSDVAMPAVKNVAGLYIKKNMDAVDLFIGCEGTLGIVTEVEIRTAELPEDRLFLIVYADSEDTAISFVEAVKADEALKAIAIEYFDPGAITLLRTVENIAKTPETGACAIYLELIADNDDMEDRLCEALDGCGLDMDSTWAGFDEKDLHEMKHFRHALPETVNLLIGNRRKALPTLHKIGTDTSVPDGKLREFLSFAREAIEGKGVEYVIFGHIGDNHLHINMIPSDEETLASAKELYAAIAQRSVDLGGSVSAEHGVGRLKKQFLLMQYGPDDMRSMKAVKDAFDPDGILNPGVMS